MTLTTTTAQTLTSPNLKRQLPKRPRLQKHRKLQRKLQKKRLRNFQAQLDLKSFHDDAWAQFLGSPDTCT